MAQDTKEWQAFFWESWVSCLILLAFRKPWDSTTHQTNTTSTERDTEKQKEINDCVIIGGGMTLAILVTVSEHTLATYLTIYTSLFCTSTHNYLYYLYVIPSKQ